MADGVDGCCANAADDDNNNAPAIHKVRIAIIERIRVFTWILVAVLLFGVLIPQRRHSLGTTAETIDAQPLIGRVRIFTR